MTRRRPEIDVAQTDPAATDHAATDHAATDPAATDASLSVLHVAQPAEYGVVTVLESLVRDQVGRGWRVGVAGPVPIGSARHLPWTASRAPGPAVVDEVRRLGALVRAFEPDVVHLHSSKAGLAGRLVIRGRLPTILQPHAWSFLALTGPLAAASLAWERMAVRWADTVLCCSEAERRRGVAAGIRGSWRVLPNPVDLHRIPAGSDADRQAARSELGLGAAPLAVCVGRLSTQKGQDVLLDAWPQVRREVPAAELVLVGDGPARGALEARAPAGVCFVGRQQSVTPWLHAADVVVQPSRYEGLSMSVLEAMASARSVVASDVEGMFEALGEGAGAIVPVEDAVTLAREVSRRLADQSRAWREGLVGRARAEQNHDLRNWGEAVAELTAGVRRAHAGARAVGSRRYH
ncbi:MAG TPA: glycosyltransferase [Acidimicrobiales bacterium]|nr:glycosyltransferase [Acidimicrobiales bacterium]